MSCSLSDNVYVVIFNNITMIKLQSALGSSKAPYKKSCNMLEMALMHINKNSHTNSGSSITLKNSYIKNSYKRLRKSNGSTSSISKIQTICNRKVKMPNKNAQEKTKNRYKPTQDSEFNRLANKKQIVSVNEGDLLAIQIESYSQRRYVSARKIRNQIYSSSNSLQLVPTRSIQHRSLDPKTKEQENEAKNRRKFKKTNKRSITQRNYYQSKQIYKSVEIGMLGNQRTKSSKINERNKSRRRLHKYNRNYGSSAHLENQQVQQNRIQFQDLKFLEKQRKIKKQIIILDTVEDKKDRKYFRKSDQEAHQLRAIQRRSAISKSKRRILTEITPKKQANILSECLRKVQSESIAQKDDKKQNVVSKQKLQTQKPQIITEQTDTMSENKNNCPLGDFSSILQINQSSFLSDAGKKLFFANEKEAQIIISPKGSNFKKQNKLEKENQQNVGSLIKDKQKKGGCKYFDQNMEPINLQAYRSIPINSIVQHQTYSRKNILHKNVVDKIKRAFPKGFFDG